MSPGRTAAISRQADAAGARQVVDDPRGRVNAAIESVARPSQPAAGQARKVHETSSIINVRQTPVERDVSAVGKRIDCRDPNSANQTLADRFKVSSKNREIKKIGGDFGISLDRTSRDLDIAPLISRVAYNEDSSVATNGASIWML